MNIFGFFKRGDKPEAGAVEIYNAEGKRIDQKYMNWLEACVTEGKTRENLLKTELAYARRDTDSREQALRIAYDFLLSNSDRESHAGRIAGVIRRVLGGKVMLVGLEHSLRARIEAGMVITKDELNP